MRALFLVALDKDIFEGSSYLDELAIIRKPRIGVGTSLFDIGYSKGILTMRSVKPLLAGIAGGGIPA